MTLEFQQNIETAKNTDQKYSPSDPNLEKHSFSPNTNLRQEQKLIQQLSSRWELRRQSAAQALKNTVNPEAWENLAKLLVQNRKFSMQIMNSNDNAVAALQGKLCGPESQPAVDILIKGFKEANKQLEECLQESRSFKWGSGDHYVTPISTLGLGPVKRIVVNLYNDLQELGNVFRSSMRSNEIQTKLNNYYYIKESIIKALKGTDSMEALRIVAESLKPEPKNEPTHSVDSYTIQISCDTLGRHASGQFADCLIPALKCEHDELIRAAAARGLAYTSSPEAIEALAESLISSCHIRDEIPSPLWLMWTDTIYTLLDSLLTINLTSSARDVLSAGLLDPLTCYYCQAALGGPVLNDRPQKLAQIRLRDPDRYGMFAKMAEESAQHTSTFQE